MAYDSKLLKLMACAVVQFAYVLLVGTFPFNSFLSGFFCSIGFFVLTGEARAQPSVPFSLVTRIAEDQGSIEGALPWQVQCLLSFRH